MKNKLFYSYIIIEFLIFIAIFFFVLNPLIDFNIRILSSIGLGINIIYSIVGKPKEKIDRWFNLAFCTLIFISELLYLILDNQIMHLSIILGAFAVVTARLFLIERDSPKIKTYIENLSDDEVLALKEQIESEGKFILELDSTFEILEEHLIFEDIEEEVKGERIIPHVIEPSFGIDRILYCTLLHSFKTEEDGFEKEYFKFAKEIAPIQVSVFPLMNKEGLGEIAIDITHKLREAGFTVDNDTSGTIGKRYARADEVGVPIAITVDFDTKEDNTVTIRDRDTEEQERVKIEDLKEVIEAKLQ